MESQFQNMSDQLEQIDQMVDEFVEKNFGKDVLISSWLMVISTLFYIAIPIHDLITQTAKPNSVKLCYYISTLVTGLLYLLGNLFFLSMSYPNAYKDMHKQIMSVDISKLSFIERYITGNNLLLMTWFFAISTLPILVYIVWSYQAGDLNELKAIGIILSIIFAFLGLSIWVIACFPENLRQNDGRGSTYVYDFFQSIGLFNINCIVPDKSYESFWKTHLGSDFLVGSWVLLILSAATLPESITIIAVYPNYFASYMFFISCVFFILGAILLVEISYPGNFQSDSCWKAIASVFKRKKKNKYNSSSAENESLLPSNTTTTTTISTSTTTTSNTTTSNNNNV